MFLSPAVAISQCPLMPVLFGSQDALSAVRAVQELQSGLHLSAGTFMLLEQALGDSGARNLAASVSKSRKGCANLDEVTDLSVFPQQQLVNLLQDVEHFWVQLQRALHHQAAHFHIDAATFLADRQSA